MEFKDILKKLRNEKGLTQSDLAQITGLTRSAIGMYELGKREPSFEVLEILADFFNVDMNTLLGKSQEHEKINEDLPELTAKDEREIESDLEDMMNSMASAACEGDEDFEDIEAFKAAVKVAMVQAKRIAKKKYTPKKYRK